MTNQNIIMLFAYVVLFSTSSTAKTYDWKGFIAQGLIQAEHSNFVNDEGDPSLRLTEVGLNGYYRLAPNLRIAGQGVYLNGGNRYAEGHRLDYLFLDWNLVNIENWQLNIHLGRVKNYHWFYSATRDVPHTRPTIILPQSIYFDVFRDVALSSDGIALTSSTANDLGEWDLYWSYGTTPINSEKAKKLLSRQATGDLDQDYAHLFSINWRPLFSRWQVGINLLDSEFTYSAHAQDIFVDGTGTSQRLMFLLRYSAQYWELTSEIMRERAIYNDVVFDGFESDLTAEGGYLQAKYLVDENTSLLARLDLYDRDRTDRSGTQFSADTQAAVPAYFAYMDQATLGLSWKFRANWQLQAELHL